jgi:flagellar biosynthesis/type III secretory pathway chaperone
MTSQIVSLTANLQEETELLFRFNDLLHREIEALSQLHDLVALDAITQEKIVFSAELEALATARAGMLGELGFETGFIGMERAAAVHTELATPWIALKAAADATRTQNDINGMVVNAKLEITQQSLDALRKAGVGPAVYTSRGRAQSNQSRLSVKAG